MKRAAFVVLFFIPWGLGFVPPKFQWKTIDFAWEGPENRNEAIRNGDYVSVHNLPTGLARWRDKLFITVPRWKKGIPSTLNYVKLKTKESSPLLEPYPSWYDAFVRDSKPDVTSNATVVSAFRVHVDSCDRLWVVDNGVADMIATSTQITDPAVLVFDLKTNRLQHRFVLPAEAMTEDSVFTSIVVEIPDKQNCDNAYAYITDMGSNALVVYSLSQKMAWRVEHPYFTFDPAAGVYRVGGVNFYWNDGVSSAALAKVKKDGYRDLYIHPTSSTKQFKISTELLRRQNVTKEEIMEGVKIVGDRGPKSQATSCDFDHNTNVLFFTQLSKNGIGCWNVDKLFEEKNTPVIIRDCNLLEYPNDIKVDSSGNLWMLSNRQSRFLYDTMDFTQVNFRVLTAPASQVIQGTKCAKGSSIMSFFKRPFGKSE